MVKDMPIHSNIATSSKTHVTCHLSLLTAGKQTLALLRAIFEQVKGKKLNFCLQDGKFILKRTQSRDSEVNLTIQTPLSLLPLYCQG